MRTVTMPSLDEPHHRLRWARARAGFKDATEAARRRGWNTNTYRSHENGIRGLKRSAALKYAAAFGVPLPWLLHGEGGTASQDPELAGLWSPLSTDDQKMLKSLMRRLINGQR